MDTRIIAGALALATILAACGANASSMGATPNDMSGHFYIEPKIGYTTTYWDHIMPTTFTDGQLGTVTTSWTNGTGSFSAGGALGYEFSKGFALEAGGIWFKPAVVRGTFTLAASGAPGTFKLTAKQYALFADIRANTPFSCGPIQPYAKFGIGYLNVSSNSIPNPPIGSFALNRSHTGPMFGVGVSMPIATSSFALTAEYLRFAGLVDRNKSNLLSGETNFSSYNSFTIGLRCSFG